MDCEHCQPELLDLAYGELEDAHAREVRLHVDGCASCRESLARLERGIVLSGALPVVEAPEAATLGILEAARAHAETGRTGVRIEEEDRPGPLQGWLDVLGRFAMGRQVAMATVTVLIVAVGLWWVPNTRREPEVAGSTVIHPDPAGEAAASPAATPLDLQVDRNGRIRAADGTEPPASRAPSKLAELEDRPAGPAAVEEPHQEEATAGLVGEEMKATDDLEADSPSGEGLGRQDGRATGLKDEGAFRTEPGRAERGGANEQMAKTEAQNRFAQAPPEPSPDPKAYAKSKPRKAQKSASGADAQLASPYAKGGAKEAAPRTAASLLKQARAERAASRCGRANTFYEELIAVYPKATEAGHAMLEAAECYQRIGREAQARRLLKRAVSRKAVAARARQMLDQPTKKARSKATASESAADAVDSVDGL